MFLVFATEEEKDKNLNRFTGTFCHHCLSSIFYHHRSLPSTVLFSNCSIFHLPVLESGGLICEEGKKSGKTWDDPWEPASEFQHFLPESPNTNQLSECQF
ncbi:calphotin-like isoform X1 [Tachysurus ichikawai]